MGPFVPRRLPGLLLSALLVAPLVAAERPTEAFDGAHDVALYRNTALVPVDSIDLLHAALDDAQGEVRGADLRLVDLGRQGVEDALFVRQHAHTLRLWGVVALLDDGSAMTAIGVKYDPPLGEWDEGGMAVRVFQDGHYDDLAAGFSRDVEADEVSWTFGAPFESRAVMFAGFSGIVGCDADGTCEQTRGLAGLDAAPDGGSSYLASVIPSVWWESVLPEQEEGGPLMDAWRVLRGLPSASDA